MIGSPQQDSPPRPDRPPLFASIPGPGRLSDLQLALTDASRVHSGVKDPVLREPADGRLFDPSLSHLLSLMKRVTQTQTVPVGAVNRVRDFAIQKLEVARTSQQSGVTGDQCRGSEIRSVHRRAKRRRSSNGYGEFGERISEPRHWNHEFAGVVIESAVRSRGCREIGRTSDS